jgi:multidrug resistance protein
MANRRQRPGGIGVVLAIVALDFAGIGLTLPIIPRLLSDVAHTSDLGWRFGAFLSLYALMQFVFSPILGIWSDRVGRRPVLLCSLAGAAVDYLFMAMAPSLGLLFVGRAIAGITGASQAVASAYLADVTSEGDRARRFGQLNAVQGLGFIAGPLIGGLHRDDCKAYWPASRVSPPSWGRWQSARFTSPIVRTFQASSGLPARRFISSRCRYYCACRQKPAPPRTPDPSVRSLKPASNEWTHPPCGW